LSRFDTIPDLDGWMDGQTTLTANTTLIHSIAPAEREDLAKPRGHTMPH